MDNIFFLPIVDCSAACHNGGTCNTTIGQCTCTQGWTGRNCQTGKEYDPHPSKGV